MRRMNFPDKSKINITQLWPCPPAQPIPDFTVSYPKECEPLLPSPFSSHFCQVGAKCQNPSKIQDQYFLETRARILVAPTFKEKLSLQVSRAFPEGAPRKVSMFKIYLAGRSSDMSISCPETILFSPKWRDSGCGNFRILTFQEHKLLACQEQLLACQEQLLACQDTSFLGSNMPWWLWEAASGGFIF